MTSGITPTSTSTRTVTPSVSRTRTTTATNTQTGSMTITPTLTRDASDSATATPSLSSSIQPVSFVMYIAGSQQVNATALISQAINSYLGGNGAATVTSVWSNGVYTVTGMSAMASLITSNFPSSVQYVQLLQTLQIVSASASPNPVQATSLLLPVGISVGGMILLGGIIAGAALVVRSQRKRRKLYAPSPTLTKMNTEAYAPTMTTLAPLPDAADAPVMMVRNSFNEVLKDKVAPAEGGEKMTFAPVARTAINSRTLETLTSMRNMNEQPVVHNPFNKAMSWKPTTGSVVIVPEIINNRKSTKIMTKGGVNVFIPPPPLPVNIDLLPPPPPPEL